MTCGNIQSSPASVSCRLDAITEDYHFAYINQLLSKRTVIECVSSLAYSNILDRVHWIVHLQHQLVAFVDSRVGPSTVVAVSVSSCIGPTVIDDPARVPEHQFLTVNTGVKIILSDLGSTCNVLLSPAALTLLVDWDQCFTVLFIQSLVVTPAQFLREQDTGDLAHSFQIIQTTRSRSSTGRPRSHLGNSLPRTETASLLVCVDDHVVLGKLCCPNCRWLPDSKHGVPFFSTCLVSTCCVAKNFACCWHYSSLFTGSGSQSLAVLLSSRPFGACFNQPTIHPLGLKARVVHDHCKRRCCGHRKK